MINHLKNISHKLYEINQNFESKHQTFLFLARTSRTMKNIHEKPKFFHELFSPKNIPKPFLLKGNNI